jgi:transglutaminase-like putative cysteine protease
MYSIKRTTVAILILSLCLAMCCQSALGRPKNTRIVEFQIQYDLGVSGNPPKVLFRTLVPESIAGKQKILDVTYSMTPRKVMSRPPNKYAEFFFNNPGKDLTVTMDVKAELYNYDLNEAKKLKEKPAPEPQEELEKYLVAEKYIEKDDPLIHRIAGGISATSDLMTTRKIYEYVIDNMKYSGYSKDDRGALYAAKNNRGDCSEYAYLMIALCRAKNIPARFVMGYTSEYKETPKHSWVEVYLEEMGWVPFDATRGDVSQPLMRKQLYQHLDNVYISLSTNIDDKLLDGHHYSAYWFWDGNVTLKESVTFTPVEQKKARK